MQSNWRVPVVVNRKKSTLFTPKKGKKKVLFLCDSFSQKLAFFLSYVTCLLTHIYIFGYSLHTPNSIVLTQKQSLGFVTFLVTPYLTVKSLAYFSKRRFKQNERGRNYISSA